MLRRLKAAAARLLQEVDALARASRDPRVSWQVRILIVLLVAYVLSPLDLVPDFIPVLGWLDELLLVPLAIVLLRRLIPPAVLEEHRAAGGTVEARRLRRLGALLVIAVWIAAAAAAAHVWLRPAVQ